MEADKSLGKEGMAYLESMPRRVVTLYMPLGVFLFVLLFPFYWMGTTALKPNRELISRDSNPFWVSEPTFDHFYHLLFKTPYPEWVWNTVVVSVVATFASLALVYALRRGNAPRFLLWAYVAVAAAGFAVMLPISAAFVGTSMRTFNRLMIFQNWI